ncbi:hypothetical protein LNKW23_15340 [Paralimibaculum aggregatum]|uniref:Zinc finger DksA/TraR C4-type domain-containing protein n=1 Tax=Paralimibaculum aggregatum TaxID=3036245 RepID=A0ABQ6LG76_9RHOB|nr:TraR/DksA C4-type zinc finger protein [Limibaculum sp. NKW23]GMG82321.1 hypothetical protein LNKW23_15340 [Limibaculum sp. NKW23]
MTTDDGLDAAALARFRALLVAEAAELEAAERDTEADRAPVELDQQSVGRLSRMDAMQVQAMAAAQSRRRAARRAAIRAALARFDEDEYGWCQLCGEAIDPRRLALDPAVARCVDCAGG